MKKNYRGKVSTGAFSSVYCVVEAESASEAIQKIKAAGHRFSLDGGENVMEDSDLRGYIKSKVQSGDYIWIGSKPNWW